MSRRAFFKTAAGMAAAFVAMNDTYGPIFGVSRAEAAIPEKASERAKKLSKQFIMDMHTHFLRDDTRIQTFLNQRKAVGQAGWNPALAQKEQTIDDLKFANYLKEIYFDSDTKVACISGSPSGGPTGLVPDQRDEGTGARHHQRHRRHEAFLLPRDLHPRLSRMDGSDRARLSGSQAGLDEGLHHRRQHQQESEQAPLAARRREPRLSRL